MKTAEMNTKAMVSLIPSEIDVRLDLRTLDIIIVVITAVSVTLSL